MNSVTVKLKFSGITPFTNTMIPDDHTIVTPTIIVFFWKMLNIG